MKIIKVSASSPCLMKLIYIVCQIATEFRYYLLEPEGEPVEEGSIRGAMTIEIFVEETTISCTITFTWLPTKMIIINR